MSEAISPRDCWRTPRWLAERYVARYALTHDAAADEANAVCPSYWTAEDDALAQDWRGRRIWCNPPYSGKGRAGSLERWIEKGHEAECCVMLLPSRTDQRWFRAAYMLAREIVFLTGRVQFDPPPGVRQSSNREGSMIVVLGAEPRATDRPLVTVDSLRW